MSGKGYLAGRTTGNTTVGAATGDAGGSYGGLGASSRGASNAVYGDYADPDDWGSGGGPSRTSPGGGLVRIVADTFQLDGSVGANGIGPWWGTSGGAGGGVRVAVRTLSGTGYIGATGAHRGGGGRIAVYAEDFSGFNTGRITAFGGTGGAGTVFLRDTDEARGTLRIDRGGSGATFCGTPLGSPEMERVGDPRQRLDPRGVGSTGGTSHLVGDSRFTDHGSRLAVATGWFAPG